MTLELRDPQKPGESLAEAVHAFTAALRADIENVRDDTPRRIHDIRVGTKKLRALLRLAAEAVPDPAPPVGCLRALRQAFSGSRDAEVMRQRVAELFGDDAEAVRHELGLDDAGSPSDLPVENALRIWTELSELLNAVDFTRVTPKGLLDNAVRSHRRARRLMRRCKETPGDDVLMHDWRKRTKDACYHAMALAAVPTMKKRIGRLDALAEKLGEYHDLALLGDRAEGRDRIFSVIDQRKRAVRKECFRAGRKILRRKPSVLREKLAAQIGA
jgi:Uncharacterized conserved protein